MRLEHFNISGSIELLETVRTFYIEVLGLADGPRPAVPTRGYWLYSGSDAVVHLNESSDRQAPPRATYLDHIAFACDDVTAMERRLQAHSIEYSINRYPAVNLTQIFLHDPAGTGIELNFR
ncbi:MAG TPA: VOC family protein [Spongiibacteraceae bacterium]|nr:VOC family protein [Spongiibacteraceae bacterium]